ncbi:MAG: hypothetical protein FJZ64_04790 [Chlamydiae bacterium]|nr:hypothetical protein [Chlamydiota bacterium]
MSTSPVDPSVRPITSTTTTTVSASSANGSQVTAVVTNVILNGASPPPSPRSGQVSPPPTSVGTPVRQTKPPSLDYILKKVYQPDPAPGKENQRE